MIPDDKVQSMKSVAEVVEGIEYLLANPDDQTKMPIHPTAAEKE